MTAMAGGQDPRGPGQAGLLAAGAAGLVAAVAALAGFRGLAGGGLLFWLAPFPLLVAGLGFGPPVALLGGAIAVAGVWLLGSGLAALLMLLVFALPAFLLVAMGWRRTPAGVRFDAGPPLALLGIWPVLLLLIAAWSAASLETAGGLAGVLHALVALGLAQTGLPADPALVALLQQVAPAALGFWLATTLALGALAARRVLRGDLLAPGGLAPRLEPGWRAVRLPAWYLLLPAAAAGLWLAEGEPGPVRLSAFLLLLLPLFLQGIAGVHARLQGRNGATAMLVAFYLLLVLFSAPAIVAVTALGLYDQWAARRAPTRPG
ncbi:hypothetical protein M0638_14295 [Roseomonas sp. NAR14]|uniref:Uncharacterized protein n=1 Tax=Roseomonas acroporae TaxID=2937791 RepID=A0A9X1YAV9_9PROT|nr:hypothetical protein [Roseomonas acroporae]MCK8785555.1 hypothetical protein [Roseomonas acroporae]